MDERPYRQICDSQRRGGQSREVPRNGLRYRIIIGAPSITVTIGGRAKYGDDLINAAETAVWAIQQIADEEKAKKEAEKEAKAARRAQKKNK